MTEDTLLTVREFASQPEVDKHPSQLYGWMKKGLPVVVVDGTKHIPFEAGLEWIQDRTKQTRSEKIERASVRSDLQPGTWLRWSRGNNLGPAYGLLQEIAGTLAVISVEYRSTPVYFPMDNLERDVRNGAVTLVHPTEIASFLLHQVSRLDFLVHLLAGHDKAKEIKNAILSTGVLPLDFVERYRENRHRPDKLWPASEELMKGADRNED